jgi:hypothetical protein
VRVTLLSDTGVFRQGRNRLWIEFRDARGRLLDAGDVQIAATMPMPGMVMSAGFEVLATNEQGRYEVAGEFGMSGVWQVTVQWNGASGRGSVSMQGNVQ